MPKVKMLSLAAGPDRILERGKVYNLPDKVAQDLVAGEFAVPSEEKAVRLPPQPDPEDVDGEDLEEGPDE